MNQMDNQNYHNENPKSSARKMYYFIAIIYLLFGILYWINRF